MCLTCLTHQNALLPGLPSNPVQITFASVLIDAGESVKAVAEYLGHSDPGFTLRVYAHLFPASEDRARKAIEAAFMPRSAAKVADA